MLPLSYYAFRGERARARLAPQVQNLYRQHGKHPERLHRELAALTAAEGTGMYAGCLPALLQLPFFSVVYRLFLSPAIGGSPNLLLRHRLLTVPLGSHWLSAVPWGLHGLVFAVLFLLLALVGWASARAARRWAATARPGKQSAPDGTSRVMAGLARVAPFGVLVSRPSCRWPPACICSPRQPGHSPSGRSSTGTRRASITAGAHSIDPAQARSRTCLREQNG